MDLDITRILVDAAEKGALEEVTYKEDPIFGLRMPRTCPGLPNDALLNPRNTWKDGAEYDRRARELAAEFQVQFQDRCNRVDLPAIVRDQCPEP
jgi:phosphoenolpyruvate carboxykinase (ATP)